MDIKSADVIRRLKAVPGLLDTFIGGEGHEVRCSAEAMLHLQDELHECVEMLEILQNDR